VSISDVLFEYDRIKSENEARLRARHDQVYAKAPELKTLHAEIRRRQIEQLRRAVNGEIDTAQIKALMKEATDMLVSAGFDAHFLDPIYTCSLCKDTGTLENGTRCSCFKKRVLEDKLSAAWPAAALSARSCAPFAHSAKSMPTIFQT
jgi:DNA replication protein DnaC